MKKINSSMMSCLKRPAMSLFALLALTVSLHASAEADVCEGNGYKLQIGSSFEVKRKGAQLCSYRSGEDAIALLEDRPGLSKDEIESFIDEGYQADDTLLIKHGELRQLSTVGGSGYLAHVTGIYRDKPVEGIAGGFVGEDGQGVAVLISSVADKWSEFEKQANAIIESIEFTEFNQQIGAREWRRMLSGAGLSRQQISEHADTRENYYFCNDGRFYSSSNQSEHVGDSGATMFGFSSSRNSGDWNLESNQGGTQLVLYYSDGREKRANLEDRDGETWVDDARYYMIENSRCR